MQPQTFVFIGQSGCGKGTQVDLLKKVLTEKDQSRKIVVFETGIKFREIFKGDNYSSKVAREIYERGGLQPDFLAVRNWSNMLFDDTEGHEHIFFDGICRRLSEAEMFTTAMEFYERQATIIFVNVSNKWAKKRLMD